MEKRIKIFFLPESESPFVKRDLNLLQRRYEVRTLRVIFSKRRIMKSIWCLFKTIREVFWADLTFSWFAGTHAFFLVFFSKLFGKKSTIVVGGYEVANLQEQNYGYLLKRKNLFKLKYTLANASLVLAVSDYIFKEIGKFSKTQNVKILYNGVDTDRFHKPNGIKKENLVITVAYKNPNIKIKGLDTFLAVSSELPDVKFMLIGLNRELIKQLEKEAPKNVEFVPTISATELIALYQRAKVFCQLSFIEGFGMALAEAMSCECTPVVTSLGALPEIVGKTGFYVIYGDTDSTVQAIKKALTFESGKMARKRILKYFNSKNREKKLIDLLDSLIEE
jgi:glycosyltransferase involved in cell wall biosynthesis